MSSPDGVRIPLLGGGFAHGVLIHEFPKAHAIVSIVPEVWPETSRPLDIDVNAEFRVRELCVLGEFGISASKFMQQGPRWELVERADSERVEPYFLEYHVGRHRIRIFDEPQTKTLARPRDEEDQLPRLSTSFAPMATAKVEGAVKNLELLDGQVSELWRKEVFEYSPEESSLPKGDMLHLQLSTDPLPKGESPHMKTRWAIAEELIARGLLGKDELIFGSRIGYLDLLIPAERVPAATLWEILEERSPKYACTVKEKTAGHAEREWAQALESWGPVLKEPRKKTRPKRPAARRRLRLLWRVEAGRWPDAEALAIRDAAVDAVQSASLGEVTDLGAGEGVMELVLELLPRKTERSLRKVLREQFPEEAQPEVEKL